MEHAAPIRAELRAVDEAERPPSTAAVAAVLEGDEHAWAEPPHQRDAGARHANPFVFAQQGRAVLNRMSAYAEVAPMRQGDTVVEAAVATVESGRGGEWVAFGPGRELVPPASTVLYGRALRTGRVE